MGPDVRFAGYGQVFQELLDLGGLFARNHEGVNVVLVRFDDWPAGQAAEFVQAVRGSKLAAPLNPAAFDSSMSRISACSDGAVMTPSG